MDSVGSELPQKGLQIGHQHLDLVTGGVYQYMGGDPAVTTNWLLVSGVLAADPNTSGWGAAQGGAQWYNSTDLQFKGWDGTQVVLLG